MHFCMDEVRMLLPAAPLFLAAWAILKVGLNRVRGYFNRAPTLPVLKQTCTCPECKECECGLCERSSSAAKKRVIDGFEHWLTYVAPLLGNNPPPDMAKYTWDQRILRDGSGYLVAGVIYPIFPTPPGADYYRDAEGLRLATAEESAAMRAEKRS